MRRTSYIAIIISMIAVAIRFEYRAVAGFMSRVQPIFAGKLGADR